MSSSKVDSRTEAKVKVDLKPLAGEQKLRY
jgi:hypothetical protein